VRSFGQEPFHEAQFAELNAANREANMKTVRLNATYFPAVEMLSGLAVAAIVLYGGLQAIDGHVTAGTVVAFVAALSYLFDPIQQLSQLYTTYQSGMAALEKIFQLLDVQPDLTDRPGASGLPRIHGEVSFENISFSYARADGRRGGAPAGADGRRNGAGPNRRGSSNQALALRDVDLRIPAGETVALVGATGAGKSTLAKLVARFYDPTAGRVLIDGHDIRAVTIDSLRRQLGVVPQEPFLFAGSLRYNIAFACPDADDEEVWEAVRAVGLADVVERMPEGLDTIVHERGQSLSSGERQLIALARAFLAHPRVLVLDEATSNLDLLSETKIEAALDVLLQARTAVLIAHRLTTAMKADRIVVVDDGRIVELGSHEELVSRGGRYAAMYATWVSHAEAQAA
jgi:ATP-binding cassette subfamily B protein